jgi:site-specific DNA recombinase
MSLVFCGVCGRKMTIRKEKNGEYILKRCEYLLHGSSERCSNSGIKVEYLEEDILKALRNHKENLQAELHLLEQQDITNVEQDLKERLAHIEAQIAENQKQHNNLIELAVAGIFSHEELKNKKQALINQLQALEESKEKLLQQANNINVSSHIERIAHIINLLHTFETISPEEQNRVLKQFVKKIHFTRNMPEDIRKLSTRNPARREFPFEVTIEYF